VSTLFKLHIIAMFVGLTCFQYADLDVGGRPRQQQSAPFPAGSGVEKGLILSTVPGMVELGCPAIPITRHDNLYSITKYGQLRL
jgi:hypothetical protein